MILAMANPLPSHVQQTNISARTPDRIATHCNTADNIERSLQEDGNRRWGFVIYCCTYSSDADWDLFMACLQREARGALEMYCGLDMLDSLSMTVFADRELFDGASTSVIRQHFKQWAANSPQQEQEQGVESSGPLKTQSQRYRYCIQVDDEALQSVIEDEPATENGGIFEGFVNVIKKDWEPAKPDARGLEVMEPIEGCTQDDVGWMMISYQFVIGEMYFLLRGWNSWYIEYRRPPEVANA